MGYLLKKSSTTRPLLFLMVQSADHISGLTGVSPTVTISKSGAAFASPAGAVTEVANGWYQVAANATDTGTSGPLLLHATATGADPLDDRFEVVSFDPDSATNLGLSALPMANPAANGGLPTVDATNNVHGLQTRTVSDASVIGTSTLTGTAQSGDAYGYLGTNLGLLGANATALAPSSTALSTTNWTNTKAGYLDTNVGSRMATYTQPTGFLAATFPANVGTSTVTDASVATDVQTGLTTQGYTTTRATYLDTLSGIVAAIWTYTTRILTAGTNIVLAKGTGLTGLNDIAAGSQMDLVNAPNATAITAIQSGLSKPGTAQTITPPATMATLANQTTIINAVNGITTNTARSAPRVPDFLARPASGSVAYTGDLYLYTLQGNLEDADTNTVTVHARNASGGSLDAGLTSTTMARQSIGFYRMTYTVNSTDPAQAVYFDFSWTVASAAMKDGAATEVQDAENYAYLAAIKAKTDLLATNAVDSPNVQTLQTQVGGIVSGSNVIRANDYQGNALAKPGTQMDLVNAPNATAITAIQLGLSRPGTAQTITPADTAASGTAQTQIANLTNGTTVVRSNDYLGNRLATATSIAALPTDTTITADVATGLTNQGYTSARAGLLDTLSGIVTAIWASASRTLTAFGFTPIVGGYAAGQDPATLMSTAGYSASRAAKLDNLDAATSTRATPAQILTNVGNPLTTDSSGKVGVNNLPVEFLSSTEQTELANAISDLNSLLGRSDTATTVNTITTNVNTLLTRLSQSLQFDVSGYVKSNPQALPPGAATASGQSDILTAVGSPLQASAYIAPDNSDIATAVTDLASLIARTDPTTDIGLIKSTTDELANMIVSGVFKSTALANAPSGGGGGGGGISGSDPFWIQFQDSSGSILPLISFTVKETSQSARTDTSGNFNGSLNAGTYTILAPPQNFISFPATSISVPLVSTPAVITGTGTSGGPPAVSISYSPLGNGATLLAVPSGGTGPYTAAWTGTGIVFSPSDSELTTATVTSSGIYTAVVVITDADGVAAMGSVTFNIVLNPIISTPGTVISFGPGTITQYTFNADAGSIHVTLSRYNSRQLIFYTLDGTVPTPYRNDQKYTGPFSITGSCRLQAIFLDTSNGNTTTTIVVFTKVPS